MAPIRPPGLDDEEPIWEFIYETICVQKIREKVDVFLFRHYLRENSWLEWSAEELMNYYTSTMPPTLYKCELSALKMLSIFKSLEIEIDNHTEKMLRIIHLDSLESMELDKDRRIRSFRLKDQDQGGSEDVEAIREDFGGFRRRSEDQNPRGRRSEDVEAIREDFGGFRRLPEDRDPLKRQREDVEAIREEFREYRRRSEDPNSFRRRSEDPNPRGRRSEGQHPLRRQREDVEAIREEAGGFRRRSGNGDHARIKGRGIPHGYEDIGSHDVYWTSPDSRNSSRMGRSTLQSTSTAPPPPPQSPEVIILEDVKPRPRRQSSYAHARKPRKSFDNQMEVSAWNRLHDAIVEALESGKKVPRGKPEFWKDYVEEGNTDRTASNWESHFRKHMLGQLQNKSIPKEKMMLLFKEVRIPMDKYLLENLQDRFNARIKLGSNGIVESYEFLDSDENPPTPPQNDPIPRGSMKQEAPESEDTDSDESRDSEEEEELANSTIPRKRRNPLNSMIKMDLDQGSDDFMDSYMEEMPRIQNHGSMAPRIMEEAGRIEGEYTYYGDVFRWKRSDAMIQDNEESLENDNQEEEEIQMSQDSEFEKMKFEMSVKCHRVIRGIIESSGIPLQRQREFISNSDELVVEVVDNSVDRMEFEKRLDEMREMLREMIDS